MRKIIRSVKAIVSISMSLILLFSVPITSYAESIAVNGAPVENDGEDTSAILKGTIIGEDINKRDKYSKHFRLDNGSYMAVSYDIPVHFEKNGRWEDYDNTLIEDTDLSKETADEVNSEEYTNKKSDIKVNYAKNSNSNRLVKVTTDDYTVSWRYKGSKKSESKITEKKDELRGNEKYTSLDKLTSEVLYENIFDNADIQYITTSIGVKENIILKNKNAPKEFEIQYQFNGLNAKQENEKQIGLYDKNNKCVYDIVAPFMSDVEGNVSSQLRLTIGEQKENELTIILSVDNEFLDKCKFPVFVDPVFTTSVSWQSSQSTFANSNTPNQCFGYGSPGYVGHLKVGSYGQGINRSFFKVNSLPSLCNGDIVVGATANFHLINADYFDDLEIDIHCVTEDWSQSTLTWNNMPDYDATVTDYDVIEQGGQDAWHTWNITKIAKKWYNGTPNYGIILKVPNDSSAYQCASFYSSAYLYSTPRPCLCIIYRNNKGLEGHWTYSSFSVGTAGTAYINDYSGNLVFITSSDATTASGILSANVHHVYNGYLAGKKTLSSKPYVGRGWNLNYQQTLLNPSEYMNKYDSNAPTYLDDIAEDYPYIFTDEDGTDIFFKKVTENNSTKYYDEDGLGFELTISGNQRTITDKKDNKSVFNDQGLLSYIEDSNGNRITVTYRSNDTKHIASITDANSNAITFATTPGSNSGYLKTVSDPSGRVTTYDYDNQGHLVEILRPNNKTVSFEYDSDGCLTSITDIDGYRMVFRYTSSANGKKISEVTEYGKNQAEGQTITFDRSRYNCTIKHTYGADGIANTNDDITSVYQFDEYGRTISVKNEARNRDLGASVYRYTEGESNSTSDNIKQLNKIAMGYSTGSNPVNLVKNPSLESHSNWIPSSWGGTNSFVSSAVTTEKYFGNRSLQIVVSSYSGDSRGRVYQDFSNTILKPGYTYTISGYIKTVNVSNDTDDCGALICAESFNSDNTSSLFYTDFIVGNTTASVDDGWQRVSKTFTIPDNSEWTRLNLALRRATGTAYFDGIQVEEYGVVNDVNLLENSGFENFSSNDLPTGWSDEYSNLDTSIDGQNSQPSNNFQGNSSFKISGKRGVEKGLKQTVNVAGNKNDTYIVSGWAKANATPADENDTRKFKLSIKITYTNGSTYWKTPANFNYSVSDWQFSSSAFNLENRDQPNAIPQSITICVRYQNQANTAYFDNICLIKDNAQSFTYDSDGNVVSVVDNSDTQSQMEYYDSNLISKTDATGYAYTYEYDNNHNMTQAKTQNGLTYNYTYNNKGQSTSLEINHRNNNEINSKTIKTEVEYNSNSGLPQKLKDADENEILYNYNSQKGTLISSTDALGETTSYIYDSNTDQLTAISQQPYIGQTASISYSYNNSELLQQIAHNGTNYNIEYDCYNNKTDSKVGTQSLASYSYNNGNGSLNSTTYGTGEVISFDYDQYGNVFSKSYNNNLAFTWQADRSGRIIRENDLLNHFQYDITSDSTGRLVRKIAKDTTKAYNQNSLWYNTEYGYDEKNNITRLVYRMPQRGMINKYSYNEDNLLYRYDINDARRVDYTYDNLNRLTQTSLTTVTPIVTSYSYMGSERGSDYTTNHLLSETIDGVTYYYDYDANGNITEISDSNDILYTYEYDPMQQLTEVMDYTRSKRYRYDYDLAGNITYEMIETVNSLGIPINSQVNSYQYGDSNWKDKLTSYKGQTITYDAIGNPLSYRDGMTMTWKNGRQLSTLQNGNNSVNYGYDSDSIRISKVTAQQPPLYQN